MEKFDARIVRRNMIFLREKAGMTQQNVADALKTSRQNIIKWEQDPGRTKAYIFRNLADLYLCNISDFFKA